MAVRSLLVGGDNSLSERLRRRRWNVMLHYLPRLAELRVIDLGGTGLFWSRAPIKPRHVTVVNLHRVGEERPRNLDD